MVFVSYVFYFKKPDALIEKTTVSFLYSLVPNYESFVLDQGSYTKEREEIKHLTLEAH